MKRPATSTARPTTARHLANTEPRSMATGAASQAKQAGISPAAPPPLHNSATTA